MKTIAKENVKELLRSWTKEYLVLAPAKTPQGDCVFDAFQEDSFALDYGKPPLPPKSVFFPHSEVIFQVENNEFREVVTAQKAIMFGIRSCDMMGLLQCASFMTRDREDIYYRVKKDAAMTVVMACPGPQNETCFCTTTLSGPVAQKGFDLQFYDAGDVFIVETGSRKGEKLLSSDFLVEMDDTAAKEKIKAFTQKAVQSISVVQEVNEAMNRLKDGSADEGVWDYFGKKCIICGGCTFVCPTCTCFNVYDHESSPGKGVRARTWDACLYGGFTREASGHNPRATQGLRLKRRHEHKLLYFNETDVQGSLCSCVGCGRCSDYCPVHIGALEVVKKIAAK
jgi:formate hydrogenlyase subunit 6/NADH:ubiquinone oxidoreductase subunit I